MLDQGRNRLNHCSLRAAEEYRRPEGGAGAICHGRHVRGQFWSVVMPWQQDESVLRTVMDLSVDGVIVIDADDRVLMFNAACEKLFGYAAADVIGHDVTRVLPRSFRAAARHKAAPEPSAKPGADHGRLMTGQRRDGTTFTVQVSAGRTTVDGKPAFVAVVRDLSEREHTARVLTEAV